jgi:arylsulfatase
LIVHWPKGFKAPSEFRHQTGHIIDIMPTIVEVSGASYPSERGGNKILPMEGRSLVPAFANQPITRAQPFFFEHEGSRAVRDGRWKLVSLAGDNWALYDLETDPTEMKDLAKTMPEQVKELSAKWETWAVRCQVDFARTSTNPSPPIARRPLSITCEVTPQARDGVILAQGGNQHGYALWLRDGHPVFGVRINKQLTTIAAKETPAGKFLLEAVLKADGTMTLSINGQTAAQGKAPSLIPAQPQDELSIGEDARTAVGDYTPPQPLKGKVEQVRVQTE